MDMKVLLIFLVLPSLGQCEVSYIYNSHNDLNMVEEGTSVTISCYFKGDKPPGTCRWTLNREVVAFDCTPYTSDKDIITPATDCHSDNGDGYANYSFIIHNVSLARDENSWVCRNFGKDEPLHLPIAVRGKHKLYSSNSKGVLKNEKYLSVTAEVGCSFPPGEVLWCLDNGAKAKCSDQTDWANGVFERNPDIYQQTEKCKAYHSVYVLRYWSTIQGKVIASPELSGEYQLYYRMNGIDYKKNTIRISIEGKCPKQLPRTTIIVEGINILLLIGTMVLLKVASMIEKFCKVVRSVGCLLILWFAVFLLLLASLSLWISTLILCKDKIWLTGCLFGAIVFLCMMHIQQVRHM